MTGGPELYINILDFQARTYYIDALHYGNAPVYDENFSYNQGKPKYLTGNKEFQVPANLRTQCEGFDFVSDPAFLESDNPDLGYGYYRIRVTDQTDQIIITFFIDTRMDPSDFINSPDVKINITRNQDDTYNIEYSRWTSGGEQLFETLQNYYEIRLWENNQEQERDWSIFEKNVELTNDFDGSVVQSQNIDLLSADYGFPEPDENNYVGKSFAPGSSITLWHSVSYEFGADDILVAFNGNAYKIRHWNTIQNIGSTQTILIPNSPSFSQVKAYYMPVLPLTVTNNLEGGSGGQYTVTWDKQPSNGITLNSGEIYNAFNYDLTTQDEYTITSGQIPQGLYGTDWTFSNWENNSTSAERTEKITSSNKDFTANYKGHFRSNSVDAFGKNTQSKLFRDDNGIYHLFYISMEKLWYTHSLTTNFTGGWSQEEIFCLDLDIVKSFSADILGNKIVFVYEANSPQSEDCGIFFFYYNTQTQRFIDDAIITSIDPAFLGNALPVISYTPNEQFILYKKDSNSPLKYVRRYLTLNGWSNWEPETDLPYSNSFSSSPSIAGIKNLGTAGQTDAIHIVFQGSERSIKYLYSKLQGNNREFSHYADISAGSGYYYNQSPSISLLGDFLPLVSWTASPQAFSQKAKNEMGVSSLSRMKARTISGSFVWGSFFETGDNVDYTFTKSAASSTSEGVISWSENDGTSSKYARRSGTAYLPKNYCFGQSGIQIGISNGTSLSEMKAVLLNTSGLPYVVNASSANFSTPIACAAGVGGTSKITSGTDITFGRSGVVIKNGVEFIYNIGDILAGDSVISFIDHPDTLLYSSAEELNDVVRSSDFYLSPNTTLFFSNFYYVNNKENADSLLTETDMVNFRAELVKSVNDQVVGTFDNITYNINNLDDYDNINYQVDLANIDQGDYYLRLVSEVEGSAEYNLSDLQNNISNLERKNYKEVYFTGDELPSAYYLSQNYPNPYNPATTINYQLPQNGFVILKVYDILGKEVTTLVNEQKTQGRYSIHFNASQLASGVYIYQLRVNDYVSSKKMLLLK